MNLTRREALRSLAATAALAVVPSTIKAIDIAPKPPKCDFIAKVHRAISHLEDLFGRQYNSATDAIIIITPSNANWYTKESVVDIEKKYQNPFMASARLKESKFMVTMAQKTLVNKYFWVTYDFDTHTWHDSTGIPFALV